MRKPEKLASGRYKVRFRVPTTGGGSKQTSETFDSQREAVTFCKWLDAIGPQGALDRLFEGEQAPPCRA